MDPIASKSYDNSNLTKDNYGYDFVVATTQESINNAMDFYLDSFENVMISAVVSIPIEAMKRSSEFKLIHHSMLLMKLRETQYT
jgi:hypothetical protein